MAVTRKGTTEEVLERYQRALPGALTAAGSVVVIRIQRIFIIFRPRGIATGATYRSITVSTPFTVGPWMRVLVGPTTDYARHLEFGRLPGKPPPIDAILAWVKEKHIGGTYAIQQGKRGPKYKRVGKKKVRDAEDRSVAWAIRHSIGEKGVKPFPAVRVGFRQSKRDALQVFRRAMMSQLAWTGKAWEAPTGS